MSRSFEERVAQALADMASAATPTKKAFVTADLADHGGLTREDANRFIDLVVDESALLNAIRVHRTDSPSGIISKLDITGPITKGATEAVAATDLSKPAPSSVEFTTKKTVSCIDITGEVQEDNIEGAGGRTTIVGVMSKQIGNDMERLSLEGDDSIQGSTAEDNLLKVNDGFLKMAVANGVTFDADEKRPTMLLLNRMLRKLPTRYRRNLGNLRWIMSANTALDLAEEVAGINPVYSAQVGLLADDAKQTGVIPKLAGVQPLIVPLMPEDLTLTGGGETGTKILLTNPQNLIYVVQRSLTIEWERVPRKDAWEGTIHMRTDFVIEDAGGVVVASDVNMNTDADGYGAEVENGS